MLLRKLILACLLLLGASLAQAADDPLYKAFGEKAGIQRLMVDFVDRIYKNERLLPFFKDASKKNLVEQLTDQLCVVSGGPCEYTGAAMKPVHADMNIGKGDFNALVEVLQQTMDAAGIPFSTQNQLLARLAPMHRDIINKP